MSGERIDWSQLWYPGPTRVFSDAELARAGGDRPSRTLVAITMVNLAFMVLPLLVAAPPHVTAQVTALLAGGLVVAFMAGLKLWQRPSRRLLTIVMSAYALAMAVVATLVKLRLSDPQARLWTSSVCAVLALLVTVTLWFLAVYRAHQIAGRLRELDESDRAVEMARQLASAQIQPHFLFNSLASLQHWVQLKDDRAAPMLAALTGFLRATLPLFNSSRLRLGDEADAVRQYLEVMRLRLGQRLRFTVEVDPHAAAVRVPPGLLLTLAENAIEHGVQARLEGGSIHISARATPTQLVIVVHDTGPGPATGVAEGVGLGNTRERLVQAYGRAATLQLSHAAGGGCEARIQLPLNQSTSP